MLPVWIHQIDIGILMFIQEYLRVDALNGFFRAVTFLGNSGWFWVVTSLVLLAFPKTRKAGIAAFGAMALGALFTNLLIKPWVARVRPYDAHPEILLLIPPQVDFSFPSGHTCAAFAAALMYRRMLPKPWGMINVALAALIAFSRLYVGAHYPTDVLGGFLIAWASARLIWHMGKAYFTSPCPREPS